MAVKRSGVGWCDFSAEDCNFIIGCSPESEGCRNCYARPIVERQGHGRQFSEVRLYPEKLQRLVKARFAPEGRDDQPFRRGPGSRPIVFLNDLSDWCHPRVPQDFALRALCSLAERDDVDWVWLTKRPQRMAALADEFYSRTGSMLPPHFWMLVTIENQRVSSSRLRWLVNTAAATRGVSAEPLLEPLRIEHWLTWQDDDPSRANRPCLDWLIAGAESGPNRRMFDPAWAEVLYDQCRTAGIPFFAKQSSALHPGAPLLVHGQHVKEFPR